MANKRQHFDKLLLVVVLLVALIINETLADTDGDSRPKNTEKLLKLSRNHPDRPSNRDVPSQDRKNDGPLPAIRPPDGQLGQLGPRRVNRNQHKTSSQHFPKQSAIDDSRQQNYPDTNVRPSQPSTGLFSFADAKITVEDDSDDFVPYDGHADHPILASHEDDSPNEELNSLSHSKVESNIPETNYGPNTKVFDVEASIEPAIELTSQASTEHEPDLKIDTRESQPSPPEPPKSHQPPMIPEPSLPPLPILEKPAAQETEETTTEALETEVPPVKTSEMETPSTEPSTTIESRLTDPPKTEDAISETATTEPQTSEPTETQTHEPSTDEPTTEPPSTEAPTTEPPSTEAPTTQSPSTEQSVSETPDTSSTESFSMPSTTEATTTTTTEAPKTSTERAQSRIPPDTASISTQTETRPSFDAHPYEIEANALLDEEDSGPSILDMIQIPFSVVCTIFLLISVAAFQWLKSSPDVPMVTSEISTNKTVEDLNLKRKKQMEQKKRELSILKRKEQELIEQKKNLSREMDLIPLKTRVNNLRKMDLDSKIKSGLSLLAKWKTVESLMVKNANLKESIKMAQYDQLLMLQNLVDLGDLFVIMKNVEDNKRMESIREATFDMQVEIDFLGEQTKLFKQLEQKFLDDYISSSHEIDLEKRRAAEIDNKRQHLLKLLDSISKGEIK